MASEMDSRTGSQEINPSSQKAQAVDRQALQPLGRQSSIYSLTLDEFQHTLSDNGKNFGSMNMDEFLNSIWTAEENQNQAQPQALATAAIDSSSSRGTGTQIANNMSNGRGIAKQPSLPGQGSVSIPEPLCRKTVDEVWSEINKHQLSNGGQSYLQNMNAAHKQKTFGDMTLEDFLVRAGIVREQNFFPAVPPQHPSMVMYQNSSHPEMVPPVNFVARPLMAISSSAVSVTPSAGAANLSTYQPLAQNGVGEAQVCIGGTKAGCGYAQVAVNYEARVGSGAGGILGQAPALGMGSPISPVPSEGLGANQDQYGLDANRGSRKRIIDGPVEKVVERRQRRMIKNRESAARSRARKQAYTVELEAELNQLREENTELKQTLVEYERKRKQYHEEARVRKQNPTKMHRTNGTLQAMRRCLSCPY